MSPKQIEDVTERFLALTAVVPLHAISNDADYDRAVSVCNQLLDAGGADEHSPFADRTNALGGFIAEYEDAHHPAVKVSAAATSRFLMEQHGLSQSDLPGV
jgi:HTH-type transcriptional regulator/antitoxin HigA